MWRSSQRAHQHSSHTTHLTSLTSHQSPRTTHLTPLVTYHSSHTTRHTALISHHSSHSTHHTTTHLTPLFAPPIAHHSSYTTHLTPLISYQTHLELKGTRLHMWGYPVLLLMILHFPILGRYTRANAQGLDMHTTPGSLVYSENMFGQQRFLHVSRHLEKNSTFSFFPNSVS